MVRSRLLLFCAVVTALALAFVPAARSYSAKYALTIPSGLSIYLCFLLLLGLALAPAFVAIRWRFFPLLCCVPYLVYASGTGEFHLLALLKLIATPALLLLIYLARSVKDAARFCWQDFAAACLLVIVVLSGLLRGIWNTPVNLDFLNRLFLIAVAASTWTVIRPVPELGYNLRLSRKIIPQALLNFAWFALIAIPLSLTLHFTRWNPRFPGLLSFFFNFLEIFLFIALLEELFFRGFLQSLLSRTWNDWRWAQLAVSCLFGLFHILHAPFPNWRYVALATIAGWFYGSAFRKTGSIAASALVHAAVDTTWRTWFSAR